MRSRRQHERLRELIREEVLHGIADFEVEDAVDQLIFRLDNLVDRHIQARFESEAETSSRRQEFSEALVELRTEILEIIESKFISELNAGIDTVVLHTPRT